MTVVAVEAVPAVESAAASTTASSGGTAAAARTGGRTSQGRVPSPSPQARGTFRPSTQSPPSSSGGAAPRTGGRTQQGARQQARAGGRTQQGTQGGKKVKPSAPVTVTDDEGRSFTLPDASVPEHSWHRWIMAEFVLAVVLVGASPFLKPAGAVGEAAEDVGKVPASLAAPLIRLTAVSLIYFILALMAQGPRSGKIAAAFGALVLLGTAFNSLPEFTTLGAVFAGKGVKQPFDLKAGGQPGEGSAPGEGPGGGGHKK